MSALGLGLVAAGSYYDENKRLAEQNRQERSMQMQEKRFGLDQAREMRAASEHDLRMEEAKRQQDDKLKAREIIEKGRLGYEAILSGTPEGDAAFDEEVDLYNNNVGAYADGGKITHMQSLPDGGRAFTQTDSNGKQTRVELNRQQVANLYARGIEAKLRFINPERFDAYMKSSKEAEKERLVNDYRERELLSRDYIGRKNAETSRISANAAVTNASSNAALHDLQRQTALLNLEQARLAVAARRKQAAGQELTPDEQAALQVSAKEKKLNYNSQELSKLFTKPVLSPRGMPMTDTNGVPISVIDTERLARFEKFMIENGYRDSDEAYLKFREAEMKESASAQNAPQKNNSRWPAPLSGAGIPQRLW